MESVIRKLAGNNGWVYLESCQYSHRHSRNSNSERRYRYKVNFRYVTAEVYTQALNTINKNGWFVKKSVTPIPECQIGFRERNLTSTSGLTEIGVRNIKWNMAISAAVTIVAVAVIYSYR
jgi:hypothetical protein